MIIQRKKNRQFVSQILLTQMELDPLGYISMVIVNIKLAMILKSD